MALEIAQRPGVEDGLPHFRYVGNLHGDEPTGRVLTLALAELLCESQREESEAQKVLSSMHLWLLPTANPDGFDQRSRANRFACARCWADGLWGGWGGTVEEHDRLFS